MANLQRTGKVLDREKYTEALRDGQDALDDVLSGRTSLGGGLLGLAGAVSRAWLAINSPACASCGKAPAVVDGLCRPCHQRPRVTSRKKS